MLMGLDRYQLYIDVHTYIMLSFIDWTLLYIGHI